MRTRFFTIFSSPALFSCLLLAVLFAGCFNPLDYNAPDNGNGLIRVALPGAGATKIMIADKSDLSYELMFSGPGGQTVTKTASWGETCTVEVTPGAWTVAVKARDAADSNKIKAIGETLVNVQAGSQNNADIKLAVYTEVDTWVDFQDAIETSTMGDSGYEDEFIVITGDLSADSTITLSHNKTVTIAAETNVAINRGTLGAEFLDIQNGHLILGSPLYAGTVTLDGGSVPVSESFFGMTYLASFTMNSGILRNNNTSTSGGAVVVVGTFTMNGGEITGNTTGFDGGAVFVGGTGTFTMNGGKISGNHATSGNGVYVNAGGTFNISGPALVAEDNDVYLEAGKTISVTGPLTQSPAVKVTPASTTLGTQILTPGFPAGTIEKVAFTNPAHSLDVEGKLVIGTTPVSSFSLDGTVTAPVRGAPPVTAGTETAQFTVGTVTWNNNDNSAFTGSNFAPGTIYKALVTLTAKPGYIFTGVIENNFSYTGATSVTNAANSVTVTITFPATAAIAGDQKTITVSGKTFALRYVPSGSFEFGSGTYTSTLTKGYWIGETEVTQELWQAIMTGSEGNPNPSTRSSGPAAGEEQGKRPVETISWYDALEFCNRLSAAAGLDPVYTLTGISREFSSKSITNATVSVDWTKNGYRLPREMEWWWAAMGASTATGAAEKAFSGSTGSNNIDNYAWYQGTNDGYYTHQVGKKQANELNIYDMTGNVSEWCWDWHETSAFDGDHTDYIGPGSGTTKVVKGGHCQINPSGCALNPRDYRAPANPVNYIGLRIVCNQQE